MEVIISTKLKNKLNELTDTLFYKQYFGYRKDAETYVQRIRDFIETKPNKPIKLCKKTTYGKYYAIYIVPKSSMQYYITYNKFKNDFLIKDIISPKTRAYLAILGV